MIKIKVSTKMLLQTFNGCQVDYITNVCKGRCCDTVDSCAVAVTKKEAAFYHKEFNVETKHGLLVPINNKCPFKNENHLCNLHELELKPIGCVIAPFTLNNNNTLIIKNRNRMLKCYKAEPKIPAYIAYKLSLVAMFGTYAYEKIEECIALKLDLFVHMKYEIWKDIQELKSAHKPKQGLLL